MPQTTTHLERLARQALADFHLESPTVSYISDSDNDVFRVEAGGRRYALRLMWPEDNDVEAVRSELNWLEALNEETDLVVPRPLVSRNGGHVTEIDNDALGERRPCGLLEWVDGEIVDAELTPDHLYAVGELTARLHEHAQNHADALHLDPRRRAFKADLRFLLKGHERVTHWFSERDLGTVADAVQRIEAELSALAQTTANTGYIHGDLHQWNYFFHDGTIRAIDFSDSGWGHYTYDFAVTLSALKYPLPGVHDHSAHYAELESALWSGYRSVRPVPQPWLDARQCHPHRSRIGNCASASVC